MPHRDRRKFHAESLSGVPIVWPPNYQCVTLRRLVWNDVERIVAVKGDVAYLHSIEIRPTMNSAVTRPAGERVSKCPCNRFIEFLDPCDRESLVRWLWSERSPKARRSEVFVVGDITRQAFEIGYRRSDGKWQLGAWSRCYLRRIRSPCGCWGRVWKKDAPKSPEDSQQAAPSHEQVRVRSAQRSQ